jgi:cephalosporin hydroxylase
MTKLTQLANKYTSDKGTQHYEAHGYTEEYAKYIPEKGEFNLLEIGIWHGDSLKMWHNYNPQLKIDAIDIDPNVVNFFGKMNNVNVYIGDGANLEFLQSVTKDTKYDFIVDDGSHTHSDIVNSFKFLYDTLKVGGYYFIEDLHAGQANKPKVIEDINTWLANKKVESFVELCNGKLVVIKK